jgi:hypothetical protein
MPQGSVPNTPQSKKWKGNPPNVLTVEKMRNALPDLSPMAPMPNAPESPVEQIQPKKTEKEKKAAWEATHQIALSNLKSVTEEAGSNESMHTQGGAMEEILDTVPVAASSVSASDMSTKQYATRKTLAQRPIPGYSIPGGKY